MSRILQTLSLDESFWGYLTIKNLEKCFLLPDGQWNRENNRLTKIQYYGTIDDHPYWHVYFENYIQPCCVIREDSLPTDFDDEKVEIMYEIINDLSDDYLSHDYYYYRIRRMD